MARKPTPTKAPQPAAEDTAKPDTSEHAARLAMGQKKD